MRKIRLSVFSFVLTFAFLLVFFPESSDGGKIPNSQAARLAYELDVLLDGQPERTMEVTQDSLLFWTAEILPFFEYEGVIGSAIAPESVTFFASLPAMEHFHVLGRAYCTEGGGGPLELNARVANPVSAWYGRISTLATLVHELGHIQGGGLCSIDSALTESTTQLATLEVLAAMANGGNEMALYSLLDEFRDMLMGYVQYEAIAGKVDGWIEFRKLIYSSSVEIAKSEKSARRWASDPATLKDILYKYSWIPVDKILRGLPAKKIPGLFLGEPAFNGVVFTGGDPIMARALVIDDLAYVLAHAGELLPPVEPT